MISAQPIICISLSDEQRDSDAAQVGLREHPWLVWNRLLVSSVMNVVDATARALDSQTAERSGDAATLRDEVCDLVDSLLSAGNTAPLTLVIRCDAQTYPHWHRLAGDQDWLRGTFAIHPFDPSKYAGAGFADAGVFTSFISDASAQNVSQYRLRSFTEADYLDFVRARMVLEENDSSLMNRLGHRVVSALEERAVAVAGQPLGQSKAKRGVQRWLEGDVIARAKELLAGSAPESAPGDVQ